MLLDAVYLGKGGRLLKWRYVSVATLPVDAAGHGQRSAVYYGYTEVSVG